MPRRCVAQCFHHALSPPGLSPSPLPLVLILYALTIVRSVEFHPTAAILASTSMNVVSLWDLEQKSQLIEMTLDEDDAIANTSFNFGG